MLPGYPAGVAATSPPYPTPGWATTQVYPAHEAPRSPDPTKPTRSPHEAHAKPKDLKATVKGYKNRLAHLTRSREQWRIRAGRAGEQITTLEVEIAELRARLAALGGQ